MTGGGTAQDYVGFSTRAAFVTWASGKTPSVGTVIGAAGMDYRYTGSGTVISDLPGWVPAGSAYPDHWAQNTTPGTTDMASAIISCAASFNPVCFLPVVYAVGQKISLNKTNLDGAAMDGPVATVLRGLSASIPIADPILALGGKAAARRMRIEYDTLSGAETSGQREGLVLYDITGGNALQRGAVIDEVYFNKVGTAINDRASSPFNVTFGTITIEEYSYAAVIMTGTSRTGNIFTNLRVSSTSYTPTYGVQFFGGTGEEIRQVNIEHAAFKEAALDCDGASALVIGKLHLEGVDTANTDRGYINLRNTNATFDTVVAVNTRMTTYNNASVFKFGRAGSLPTGAASRNSVQLQSTIQIGELFLQGLSDPSSVVYPTYPAGRRGVSTIPGFTVFRRDPSFTDANFRVSVHQYSCLLYTSDAADE